MMQQSLQIYYCFQCCYKMHCSLHANATPTHLVTEETTLKARRFDERGREEVGGLALEVQQDAISGDELHKACTVDAFGEA